MLLACSRWPITAPRAAFTGWSQSAAPSCHSTDSTCPGRCAKPLFKTGFGSPPTARSSGSSRFAPTPPTAGQTRGSTQPSSVFSYSSTAWAMRIRWSAGMATALPAGFTAWPWAARSLARAWSAASGMPQKWRSPGWWPGCGRVDLPCSIASSRPRILPRSARRKSAGPSMSACCRRRLRARLKAPSLAHPVPPRRRAPARQRGIFSRWTAWARRKL